MSVRSHDSRTRITNPVLVGTSIVVTLLVALFLSYNANRGLPFVKTFDLTVAVPDAAELVTGSEVRIGGFRVGQVNGIEAIPPRPGAAPYARLTLALDGSIRGIPADTTVQVRPRSLLGAKYVDLVPGGAAREVTTGGALPLRNARTSPELDEAFSTFDPPTRAGLQGTIRGFGDAVAGRGGDINRSIAAAGRLMAPLQRVAGTLARPATDLAGFVDAVARTAAALAPVAEPLGDLLDGGATTLAAVDGAGDALERSLDLLPPTQEAGLRALRTATPVLDDANRIVAGLRPAVAALPQASERLTGALRSGTRVLRRTPELAEPLDAALDALDTVARDPSAPAAVRRLTTVVQLLEPTLRELAPAQLQCNIGGIWARNLQSATSHGDAAGAWMALVMVFRTEQTLHSAQPDPDLHFNPYPVVDGSECEAGNEPYSPGLAIGNPGGLQPTVTERTAPPGSSLLRARRAGLLDHIPGARR